MSWTIGQFLDELILIRDYAAQWKSSSWQVSEQLWSASAIEDSLRQKLQEDARRVQQEGTDVYEAVERAFSLFGLMYSIAGPHLAFEGPPQEDGTTAHDFFSELRKHMALLEDAGERMLRGIDKSDILMAFGDFIIEGERLRAMVADIGRLRAHFEESLVDYGRYVADQRASAIEMIRIQEPRNEHGTAELEAFDRLSEDADTATTANTAPTTPLTSPTTPATIHTTPATTHPAPAIQKTAPKEINDMPLISERFPSVTPKSAMDMPPIAEMSPVVSESTPGTHNSSANATDATPLTAIKLTLSTVDPVSFAPVAVVTPTPAMTEPACPTLPAKEVTAQLIVPEGRPSTSTTDTTAVADTTTRPSTPPPSKDSITVNRPSTPDISPTTTQIDVVDRIPPIQDTPTPAPTMASMKTTSMSTNSSFVPHTPTRMPTAPLASTTPMGPPPTPPESDGASIIERKTRTARYLKMWKTGVKAGARRFSTSQ